MARKKQEEKQSMSMNVKHLLRPIALQRCRELRSRMTEAEGLLWQVLRRKNLGVKFYRQHPLYHDIRGMESFFIADFYCHSARLVVEVDGEIHKRRISEDAERTEILELLGIRVVRFKNVEILNNLAMVLKIIREECDGRTFTSPPFPREGPGESSGEQ